MVESHGMGRWEDLPSSGCRLSSGVHRMSGGLSRYGCRLGGHLLLCFTICPSQLEMTSLKRLETLL